MNSLNQKYLHTYANVYKLTSMHTLWTRLSGSGSNQLEDVTNSIVFPPAKSDQPSGNGNKKGKKRQKEEDDSVEKKTKGKKNAVDNETTREVHSPAMGTRSKVPTFLSSPAMGTRSKRRLSI